MPFKKANIPEPISNPDALLELWYNSNIIPPVAKNITAAARDTISNTALCKGLFSTVVMIMMMEIIMNPIRVPNITAHLDLYVNRKEFSAMNIPVAIAASTSSSILAKNVGDLKWTVELLILEKVSVRVPVACIKYMKQRCLPSGAGRLQRHHCSVQYVFL